MDEIQQEVIVATAQAASLSCEGVVASSPRLVAGASGIALQAYLISDSRDHICKHV